MEWSFVWCINPGAKKHHSRCSWWIVVQSNLLQKTYCQYHPRPNHLDCTTQFLFLGTFLNQGKNIRWLVASYLARTLWLPYRKIWPSWLKSSRIYSLWRPGKEGWNCLFFFLFFALRKWMNFCGFFLGFPRLPCWFLFFPIEVFWKDDLAWWFEAVFDCWRYQLGRWVPWWQAKWEKWWTETEIDNCPSFYEGSKRFLDISIFVQLLGASIDCQELHRFCFFWQQKAENCDQLWSTIFTIDLRPKCFPDDIFSQVLVMNQALQIHHLLARTTTSCSFHLYSLSWAVVAWIFEGKQIKECFVSCKK